MEQTPTEFPCCVWDGWDGVQLGDDGLPLVITRDNISTWFEWNEIPMPENSDSLSDSELILKFADSLKAKSCYGVISYADALYFSRKNVIEILKGLDWTNDCFSHYPPELRKILKEFALSPDGAVRVQTRGFRGQANTNDPVALLRKAIKERDEEIARKKAEEEARAEAERIASEKAERERHEAYEKLQGFLESIGDFEMHGPSSDDPDCDEAVVWLESMNARVIPFKECWHQTDYGFCIRTRYTGMDLLQLHICYGFDQNVQLIIKWMVDNGAREPNAVAA